MKCRLTCLIGMIFVCAMTMAQTNAYPLLPMPQNYKVTDKSFAMGKVKLSTPVLKSEWEAFIVNWRIKLPQR